jgi:hypothetical protein
MKKTTTIENTSSAQLRTLSKFEAVINTRHTIECDKCGYRDEFNEGDSMDAAAWFQMVGWMVRGGRAKCSDCNRR